MFNFKRPRFSYGIQPLLTRDVLRTSVTLDFPSVATGANQELTATVKGAAVGDDVIVTQRVAPTAGIIYSARVTAADTVTVRAQNPTAGAIDPASQVFQLLVLKAF